LTRHTNAPVVVALAHVVHRALAVATASIIAVSAY
jgi:hypothetical protein